MRLFFALWPDREAADRLERLAADLAIVAGGRVTPRQKIHLTLAFLGEVADPAAAQSAAAALRLRGLEVRLDCVGSFRGARVAWAGSLEPDAALARMQAALAAKLRDLGFTLEDRPFTPHVTLARKIERAVPRARIAPIAWSAAELTLVRSQPGTGDYSVIGSWRLRR